MMKTTELKSKHKSDIWLKAAVVGGLWASLEIIIGSFLHNARLPMAGSTLAFFGTILLLGYSQIWPDRGLIIRAGLITAIMKSVSPSAIILGPMTGIILEAIMIELALIMAGRNIVGYIIAGILSVSSALFYKILSMLIYYGYDLIQVYVNIINFGLKQVKINEALPVEILFVLLGIYIIMGTIAAIFGYYAGQKALKLGTDNNNVNPVNNSVNDFFLIESNQKTSVPLLIIHVVAIPVGLFLINIEHSWVSFFYLFIYMIFVGIKYRSALRRLRKPVFWMQLIIIVLLSGLFWKNDVDEITLFQLEGFYAGLEMMFRALFVIIGFTAISVELRNYRVKSFLMRVGMGQFYKAIGLAFSALPTMISFLPKSKEIISHPIKSLLLPLVMADSWLRHFEEMESDVVEN